MIGRVGPSSTVLLFPRWSIMGRGRRRLCPRLPGRGRVVVLGVMGSMRCRMGSWGVGGRLGTTVLVGCWMMVVDGGDTREFLFISCLVP